MPPIPGIRCSVLAIIVGCVLSVAPLQSADPPPLQINDLREGLPEIAKNVLALLEKSQQTAVAVGDFQGAPQLIANAGPGLKKLLAEELERQRKGVVQTKAPYSLSGRYAIVPDPKADVETGLVMLKLTLQVLDDRDELVTQFVAELRSNRDIAQMGGVTAWLDPEGTRKTTNVELGKRAKNPQAFIDGSKILARQDSSLAVELHAKQKDAAGQAAPRPAKLENGQAFVELKKDELYEIVLHNNADYEVGATITVDGLSVFAFSEVCDEQGTPSYSRYVVGPHKTISIPGWHRRDQPPDNYSSFLVTEYGMGASAKAPMHARGNTGVITVAFSAAYVLDGNQKPRNPLETGFGPPVSVKVEPVKRGFEPPHEFITIRYAR